MIRISTPAAARSDRQPACRTVGPIGLSGIVSRKREALEPRQAPVVAQNVEQLLRQHDVAFLAAIAAFDPHGRAVVDPEGLSSRASLAA